MFTKNYVVYEQIPGRKSLTHRPHWGRVRTMPLLAIVLGAAASGCDRTAVPVTWQASGVQVTRIEMPLDENGTIFRVGEYVLKGREGDGRGAREFRDRVLLTTHAQGIASQVLGYVTRTYDGGHVRTFRLYGTERRVARDSKMMVVIGRAHGLNRAGAGPYPFMAWVELRLDSATGRILAKGSCHGTAPAAQARADSRPDSASPESTPVK